MIKQNITYREVFPPYILMLKSIVNPHFKADMSAFFSKGKNAEINFETFFTPDDFASLPQEYMNIFCPHSRYDIC